MARLIIDTIKAEALQRGYHRLTLASTPNAVGFYQQHGFRPLGESFYPSKLAGSDLRCTEMAIDCECPPPSGWRSRAKVSGAKTSQAPAGKV